MPKKLFMHKSQAFLIRPLVMVLVSVLLLGEAAWGQAVPAIPPGLLPLNQTPVPEPVNIFSFVKNKAAAIRLGKALFWDMQAGSDGVQACGTCHFKNGADPRLRNQLSPGLKQTPPDNLFGNISPLLAGTAGVSGFPQFAPDYALQPADFPLHQRAVPVDLQASPVIRDTNDVVSSQGVRLSQFKGITPGSAVDVTAPLFDTTFNDGLGNNVRRVEPRNAPTVINAVFNFSNFWDGRAHFMFNGESPFGPLDPNAGVWFNNAGFVTKQKVVIEFASLASQAVGPPTSEFEMSARGRSFPDIGTKMLALTPLGKQLVHPGDSVLGALSRAAVQPDGTLSGLGGLNTTYTRMIQDAFQNFLWDSPGFVAPGGFSQMEANFSLFWGLAIQLYEATLVSDQTPFDSFLGGTASALTPTQQQGFALFFGGVTNCSECHAGTEMTTHSVDAIKFVNNANNRAIEFMNVADGAQVIYDDGFNNTGVTPTEADIGRGGTAPFINPMTGFEFPLAFSRLAELQAQSQLPFPSLILPAFVPATQRVNADGSFKVPDLRNVELTAPYFHNGSAGTLADVVDFYVRGGNFPKNNIANLDPIIFAAIPALQGDAAQKAALVEFLKSLTDPRVVAESAPFDHPEIFVPEGGPFATEVLTRVPARDALGNVANVGLTLNAVASPTNNPNQTLSGSVQSGVTPTVTVNATAIPVTVSGTQWSAPVSGLVEGTNAVLVSALSGTVLSTVSAAITLDTVPPILTMNAFTSPARIVALTVSGTVEPGLTPAVSATPPAVVGPVTVSAGAWSAPISGLTAGTTNITATATDAAHNVTTATDFMTVIFPDGSFSGGTTTILDALKALHMAVKLVTPTPAELLHGDVAPLGTPDGAITVADALLILKKAVGLISF